MLYAETCGVHIGESVLALSFLRNLTVSTNVRISTSPSLSTTIRRTGWHICPPPEKQGLGQLPDHPGCLEHNLLQSPAHGHLPDHCGRDSPHHRAGQGEPVSCGAERERHRYRRLPILTHIRLSPLNSATVTCRQILSWHSLMNSSAMYRSP